MCNGCNDSSDNTDIGVDIFCDNDNDDTKANIKNVINNIDCDDSEFIDIDPEFLDNLKTLSYDDLVKNLSDIIIKEKNTRKKRWVKIYLILNEIETKKLFLKNTEFKNISSWINFIANKNNVRPNWIRNICKAGRIFKEYNLRRIERGEKPISINSVDLNSDDVAEINESNDTDIIDKELEGLISGNITREDIRNSKKIRRKQLENQGIKADPKNGYDRKKMKDAAKARKEKQNKSDADKDEDEKRQLAETAVDLVLALGDLNWLNPMENFSKYESIEYKKYKYYKRLYKVHTEVAIQAVWFDIDDEDFDTKLRKARRMDVVVGENITSDFASQIHIHGIEIKVSKNDLLGDDKMEAYAKAVDYFWIAVPKELEDLARERANGHDDWGILILDDATDSDRDGQPLGGKKAIKIAKEANLVTQKAIYRAMTMDMLYIISNGGRLKVKND